MPEPGGANQFLVCAQCAAVFRLPPSATTWHRIAAGARRFLTRHGQHGVEGFVQTDRAPASDLPYWDPLATLYFEASNGRLTLLVRRSRASIDQPARWELVGPGRIRCELQIVPDTDALLQALDREFFPLALHPHRFRQFARALESAARGVDPDTLHTLYELAEVPNTSVALLPATALRTLVEDCRRIFPPEEFPRVRSFLLRNWRADGLLTLRVARTTRLCLAPPFHAE